MKKRNPLLTYQQKRNFSATPEPSGAVSSKRKRAVLGNRFSIQEHHARRLHYDLRLEMEGVLKSWAMPKGLPESEQERRLAVRTEDHPLDYIDFEGIIPEGNYGGGKVVLWELGTYRILSGDLNKGKLTFALSGRRHHGQYTLVRTERKGEKEAWLIMKTGSPLPSGEDRIPSPFAPMRAALGDAPFTGSDWFFEEKWDGVRAVARLIRRGNKVQIDLWGRNLSRFESHYPEVIEGLRALMDTHDSINSLILDGEIVAPDENGQPSFQRLQHRIHLTDPREIEVARNQIPVTYLLFDLLYVNGKSLTDAPLLYRRELLDAISLPASIRLSTFHPDGMALFDALRKKGGEGIVAKRKESRYISGRRSREWIKVKIVQELDCVVAGWTEGRGNRSHTIGALLLGLYEGKRLKYIAHTGSGFDGEMLRYVETTLCSLEIDRCPFDSRPKTNARAHWAAPRLVARVKFTNWTDDRHLRAPIFLGLRDDVTPEECRFEQSVTPEVISSEEKEKRKEAIWIGERVAVQFEGNRLEMSHLENRFWPERGYTKAHLIDYYVQVAPFLLPHLADRPLTLIRFPEGIEGASFYQKDWKEEAPPWVKRVTIETEEETMRRMVVCNNASTLVWLANLGNIELHPSYSRIDTGVEGFERPDFIVFDIDPPKPEKGVLWDRFVQAAEVALWVKEVLDRLGLHGYLKTTGKTGLHCFVPIIRKYTYDQTRQFARIIAEQIQSEHPRRVTTAWQKRKREEKVLVDFNQNARGKTLASIYSPRAVPEATVSVPIAWEELPKIDPRDFTLETAADRVKIMGDLWVGILDSPQDPQKVLNRLHHI